MPSESLDYAVLQALEEAGDWPPLAQALADAHPADAADFLQSLEPEAMREAFRHLPRPVAASIILELDEPMQQLLVELHADDPRSLAAVVNSMEADDAADVLEKIEEQSSELAQDVLGHMDDAQEADVRQLRQYPPESAGGRMHTEFFAVGQGHTAGEALTLIREFGREHHTADLIHNVFVVDERGLHLGTAVLYEVVLANPDTRLRDLMDPEAPFAPVFLDQEEVAALFRRHDVVSMPVTNMAGKVIGRITADDVLDVLEAEATEDMYLMHGLNEEDHIFATARRSVQKRLPWLFVNMVTCILAASVIALFEGTVEEVAVLAVFMPVVAGLGGNAGIQTLTMTVRALALGELQMHNARQVIRKELAVGLVNGLVAGLTVGCVAWLWRGSVVLALVLVAALVASLFFAVFVGTVIPLILKRMNSDPALASGIFTTALTDGFGIFVFLGLATLLLRFFH